MAEGGDHKKDKVYLLSPPPWQHVTTITTTKLNLKTIDDFTASVLNGRVWSTVVRTKTLESENAIYGYLCPLIIALINYDLGD